MGGQGGGGQVIFKFFHAKVMGLLDSNNKTIMQTIMKLILLTVDFDHSHDIELEMLVVLQ